MSFRSRAGMVTALAGLGAAALLSATGLLAAHSAHRAGLSAATSTAIGSNAAMPHSPQLMQMFTNSATRSITPAADPGPKGVDVASFQHPNGAAIDWTQVAGAGYKFAFVKATEGDYPNQYVNPYYAGDIAGASAAGMYAMAYDFAIPNSTFTAAQQADFFLATVTGSLNGATPQVALDIEYNPYGTDPCYGLTTAQMVSWITKFNNEIRLKAGQAPIIYSTAGWWNTCTGDSTAFRGSQIWIASPTTSPTLPGAWPTWTFWQYSGSGSVPGISGSVDLDFFNSAGGTLASPGAQTSVNGAPVWLQAHALVGTSPYTATGLPPGLSFNTSTGLISGWLTTPGTYTASVTGSATGTAPIATTGNTVTFTWTVNAAPNSGPTGNVVLDYGGKCMDDPGSLTADGTRVDIWSCNGGSNQHWTMAQDRTVRVFGKCLDVYHAGTTDGTPVDLYTCNGTGAQQWRLGWDGHLINTGTGKCLDDPGYVTTNGTKLDIRSCTSGTNQRWTVPAGPMASEVAPLCMDDTAYSTADGNPIQVWTCTGNANQAWTVKPDGTIRVYGKCLDVYHSGTANGTRVDLYTCNGTGAQQWLIRGNATLQNPQSGRCLADPGDSSQTGTRLVIFDCSTAGGQNWRAR